MLPPGIAAEKETSWPLIVALLIFALTCFLALALYFRQISIDEAVAARVAETRLHEALNALDTPFAYFDEDNRLRIWNNAYLEMHAGISDLIRDGAPYEDLLRALVGRGLAKNAVGQEEGYIAERLRQHREGDFRGERQLSNGRWVTSRKMRAGDGGVVAIWTDVTRLKEQQAELIRARNSAEDASKAKSEFLANMSHELRTPLNAINGFSEVISQQLFGPVPDRYRVYARDINASGNLLLSLINDILDLSKVEAGALELDEQEFPLERLVVNLRRMVEARGQDKGLDMRWPVTGMQTQIKGDFRLLLQVLLNLLSNAIKFTGEGGEVSLEFRRDGTGLEMIVADTGIGMTQAEAQEAMQPFMQVGLTSESQSEGTGLGLPLVQKFVELHGGEIEVESTPGEGTTVTVRLFDRVRGDVPESAREDIRIVSSG